MPVTGDAHVASRRDRLPECRSTSMAHPMSSGPLSTRQTGTSVNRDAGLTQSYRAGTERIRAAQREHGRGRHRIQPCAVRTEERQTAAGLSHDGEFRVRSAANRVQRNSSIQSSCGPSRYGAKTTSSRGDTPKNITNGPSGPNRPWVRGARPSTLIDLSSPQPSWLVR